MIRGRNRYDIGKIIAGRVEGGYIVVIANGIVPPIACRCHEETSPIVCIGYSIVQGLGKISAPPAGVNHLGPVISGVHDGLNSSRRIREPVSTENP